MLTRILLSGVIALLAVQPTLADIMPVYQVAGNDVTWMETGLNTGVFLMDSSNEVYTQEVWERPVKDGTLNVSGTTWTTTDEYWAYGDLKSAKWGVGTSMGDDYFFAQLEVVGDFTVKPGQSRVQEGHKGHYYFYFKPSSSNGRAIEVNSAKDLTANFGDPNNLGQVKRLIDNNGDVTGSGLNVTFDMNPNEKLSDGFENSQTLGEVRRNGNILEIAVSLNHLGLSLVDFSNPLEYAYAGVAVSNPSSPISDLFANDEFSQSFGSGVEYDTLLMGTTIPEPSSLCLVSLAAFCALSRRRCFFAAHV